MNTPSITVTISHHLATITEEELNSIAIDRYGQKIVELPPYAALWLAEYIADQTGFNFYKKIKSIRKKMGLLTEQPGSGSILNLSIWCG